MESSALSNVVKEIISEGKGILALDWSPKTITQKFLEVGLTSTPELNRVYRQMLLTSPGIEKYISGVILHEETAKQSLDNGISFPDYLTRKGITPGIKVDQGAEKFGESEEEVTLGLDGLGDRLSEYKKFNLKFTKWRAVFKISDIYPSKEFIEENLNRLVEYAKISISFGFVPILEPEVSMKGNHTTTRCGETTEQVLITMFEKLKEEGVDLSSIILKTNMILPGQEAGIKAEPLEVAEATLRILKRSVPSNVFGIVFLSGGQTPEEATSNLNEIAKRKGDSPWDLSFSYARALQGEALKTWSGRQENITESQNVFLKRLEEVAKARGGNL